MLDGDIRARAEAFFQAELSDVEICFGSHPAGFAGIASTEGNRVYLDLNGASLSAKHTLEILGHELTHVVQQRQGRVQPKILIGGRPGNNDADLEQEAEEMGRRFVYGGSSILPRLPFSPSHPAVIQQMVNVGGRSLSKPSELSPKAQIILELIKGGESWLAWVVDAPASQYHFTDEYKLLEGIQSGLHGSTLVLLEKLGLLLHPAKLTELSEDELRTLLAVENSTEGNSIANMSTKKALAANGLWSQSELVIGEEFLSQVGVEKHPVFQAMTLSDRIALFNLVNGAATELSLNPMIQKEAAAFSVAYSQNPKEFVDYYQYYLSSVQETPPQPKLAGKRARFAEAMAESLSPLLYDLLWCPSVQSIPTPAELLSIVRTWIGQRNRLGFARLSAALFQITQNAELKGATGAAAKQAIDRYMDEVQNVITQQAPVSVTSSQDGNQYYYAYDSRLAKAELCLSEDGNLTLNSFQAQKGAEMR